MRPLPWTLYRYIGKEILLITCFGLLALSLLVMIVFGYRAVQNGFDLRVIMPWLLGCLGFSLFLTIPIALLFASTLCFGRMVADKEYTALCAAGVSPTHLYVPMGVFSAFLTLGALLSVGTAFPAAHYAQRNIGRYLVKQLEHLGKGQKRKIPIPGGLVYCERIDGSHLEKVYIEKEIELDSKGSIASPTQALEPDQETEKKRVKAIFTAESADVSVNKETGNIILTLRNFRVNVPDTESDVFNEDEDWHKYYRRVSAMGKLDLEFPINERSKRTGDKTDAELREDYDNWGVEMDRMRKELETALNPAPIEQGLIYVQERRYKILSEIWSRRAMALTFFTFPFIGFPLSLVMRYRHRLVAFFIGNLVTLLVFYPTLVLGETLAELGAVPAPIALLAGNFMLLGAGLLLSGRLFFR